MRRLTMAEVDGRVETLQEILHRTNGERDTYRRERDEARARLAAVEAVREKCRTMPVQTPAAIGLMLDAALREATP